MILTLQIILALWLFWILYVLVMGIYRAHLAERLTGVNRLFSLPIIIVGYTIDVLANMTIATVLFFDIPKELLVTDRLKRYIRQKRSWRKSIAVYICDHILDPFDPKGDHC